MVFNSPQQQRKFTLFLGLLTIITALVAVRYGAIHISWSEQWHALLNWKNWEELSLHERIYLQIRLPRMLLSLIVGATLAMGGVLLQALFRNPIVEPGLIGTASGAALGAALYFVLGASLPAWIGSFTLPLSASLMGMLATAVVLLLSHQKEIQQANLVSVLLTGMAVNALCLSAVGFLSYIARDPQARSITFWGMGTLSGANWQAVSITAVVTFIGFILAQAYTKQLNALLLGEADAHHLGVSTQRLKWSIITLNVVMVAVATSFVGVISFVGLIVPHLLRMIHGADNRLLLRNSAFAGAIVLTLSDTIARLVVAPAELPIGIVTSLVGVPVFIFLLRHTKLIS